MRAGEKYQSTANTAAMSAAAIRMLGTSACLNVWKSTITSIIASFKVFDIIKFLTGGGPNYASTVIVYQIYEEGFQRFNMGYASAMSWALFLVIVVVSSVTSIIQRRSAE